MKICNAKVCVQCEELLESSALVCPSCTGKILFPLASWLLETKVQQRQDKVLQETLSVEEGDSL